jgi:heme exporter protein A
MKMEITVSGSGLKKTFNRRVIFQGVSFSLSAGETLLITGRNGSGKSTLMKIIARILTPTAGEVTFTHNGLTGDRVPSSVLGFVSPYLNLYDEFSARENLAFSLSIRGFDPGGSAIDKVLEDTGLGKFKTTPARVFSSGMKQRLKYAFALIHRPPVLLLDEPMSNLDTQGKDLVRNVMQNQVANGALVVATNDAGDVDRYTSHVNLDETL